MEPESKLSDLEYSSYELEDELFIAKSETAQNANLNFTVLLSSNEFENLANSTLTNQEEGQVVEKQVSA